MPLQGREETPAGLDRNPAGQKRNLRRVKAYRAETTRAAQGAKKTTGHN